MQWTFGHQYDNVDIKFSAHDTFLIDSCISKHVYIWCSF